MNSQVVGEKKFGAWFNGVSHKILRESEYKYNGFNNEVTHYEICCFLALRRDF